MGAGGGGGGSAVCALPLFGFLNAQNYHRFGGPNQIPGRNLPLSETDRGECFLELDPLPSSSPTRQALKVGLQGRGGPCFGGMGWCGVLDDGPGRVENPG